MNASARITCLGCEARDAALQAAIDLMVERIEGQGFCRSKAKQMVWDKIADRSGIDPISIGEPGRLVRPEIHGEPEDGIWSLTFLTGNPPTFGDALQVVDEEELHL